jgi:tRNA threonylcarbamoyladenosine biosynthesis protein TsaE
MKDPGRASFSVESGGVEATRAIGRAVGRALPPGAVVALCGPLGAGKTQFVKGMAEGLAVDACEPVVSPTFVLVREYAGRQPLVHADLYRLASREELEALGLEERAEAGSIVVVEWADRFREYWPTSAVWIELAYGGGELRIVDISSSDHGWIERAKQGIACELDSANRS